MYYLAASDLCALWLTLTASIRDLLDLSCSTSAVATWTWGSISTTGSAPPTQIERSHCHYDSVNQTLRVVTGLRWESGAQQAMDVYALDMPSLIWTTSAIRGRWNINWKPEATIYVHGKSKLIQLGRHPLTNFSDTMVLNTTTLPTHSNNGQASIFVDLTSPDRECTVPGIFELPSKQVLMLYTAPTRGFACFGSVFSWSGMNGKLDVMLNVGMTPAEFISPVQVGDRIIIFDMSSLSHDRVAVLNTKVLPPYDSRNAAPIAPEMRTIKASTRAPQRPRIGASVVQYDGFVIFFGGLVESTGSKSTNELAVLSIGPHRSVENVLDDLEKADEALGTAVEPLAEIDTVELSPKKGKKKNKKKIVKFEDGDEGDSDSSSAEARKEKQQMTKDGDKAHKEKEELANDDKKQEQEDEEARPDVFLEDSDEVKAAAEKAEQELLDAVLARSIADAEAEASGAPLPSAEAEKPAIVDVAPSVDSDPAGALEHWLVKHQNNTMKLLDFAVNNADCYPDMAFKVEGKIFWAHKAVISARSSRWRQKFESENKSKTDSPSTGRRGDLEDSQLDVSTESAMPPMPRQGSNVISPFMFSRLGSGAIDMMLEEDDKAAKHEMVTLPIRLTSFASHPEFSGIPALSGNAPPPPPAPGSAVSTTTSSASITSAPSPSSSSDSVVSMASSSGIAPPAKSVPIYTLEDLTSDAFLKVLRFMYTGQISLWPREGEHIGDVAHEFLLDEVSLICREGSGERSYNEPILKLSRMLRRLVGSGVGSDYFFVVRRKKLFAHRFLIMLFSQHFRTLMNSRPDKSYVEIRELQDLDVTVETFIDFCRMLYSNFGTLPEHAEKKMDVAAMTRLSVEWNEYRCLALLSSVKPDAASTLNLFRLAANNKFLLRDVRRRILTFFGKFAQDKKVIQTLTRSEQVAWRHLGTLAGASYLDKMWFAYAIGDQKELADMEKTIGTLINVENVLPVLFGAHQAGLKGLRSLCMDFMTAHSTSIEDARRMQVDAPLALGKVAGLSASLNNELTSKLSSATASAGPAQKVKRCSHCTKTFPTFGKKTNCALCHKITCADCTKKKVTIPPIFGFSKPRDICVSCSQVVGLWTDPSVAKAQ